MEFFGNKLTAEIIARIFSKADKEMRLEMLNDQNVLDVNERDRVSTVCALIRSKIRNNPFVRSLTVQAHGMDTTQRDSLFVFRYKDEIKIGMFEAKFLRINKAKLDNHWDWYKTGTKHSHFTEQVKNQQKWLSQAAVWDMFIPNCPIGEFSPLKSKGSSNVWADEMHSHINISNPNVLWTYNHVLQNDNYISMYEVIKEIFRCKKGERIKIKGLREITIQNDDGSKIMDIPIPCDYYSNIARIKDFLIKNKSIASFNYYRFDDLFDSVKNYKEQLKVNVPYKVESKASYNEKVLKEYNSLVEKSFSIVKKEL